LALHPLYDACTVTEIGDYKDAKLLQTYILTGLINDIEQHSASQL